MTKAQKAGRQDAIEELRKRLHPGQEILCVLRHCSKSGMSRVIDLKVIEDGEIRGLGWFAARALGDAYDTKRDGIKVTGCGMDMGFHLVYSLSRTLWPDGFDCINLTTPHLGKRPPCPSNDHSNREDHKHHRDGGYALRSRWL